MKWVKLLIVGLVVAGALFFLISRPEDAGDAVQGAVAAVVTASQSVG